MKKQAFISLALSYLNFPAVRYTDEQHGIDVTGFDCSGFVNFLLTQAGYPHRVPRHANELFDSFGILIHEQFRSPGDLIFFSYRGGTYPDHMGIMISANEYIHSPGTNGTVVCLSTFERENIEPEGKAQQIYFSNPIGLKRITLKEGRYQQPFLHD